MKQLNSHMFTEIYKEEGININDLGCVMLETESIPKPKMYDLEIPEAFYEAKHKDHYWIRGWVGDKPHVSLLYGLLTPAYEQPENIEKVLKGWELPEVTIKEVGYFESPDDMDEEYYCIIGLIEVTPKLKEAMERLSFLPHINTFAGYKPHVTIAYVKKDEKLRDRIVSDLTKLYAGKTLKTEPELDLGSKSISKDEKEKKIKINEYRRCLKILNRSHSDCPQKETCIGYRNAYSDLLNNPPKD